MNRERPRHPFQLAIEQAWDQGHTARLLVLGERLTGGSGLPQHVLAKYKGQPIPIDLDPSYPMKPEFFVNSFYVNLAFAGTVLTCVFPWSAILVVQDLADGIGFVRLMPKPSVERDVTKAMRFSNQVPPPRTDRSPAMKTGFERSYGEVPAPDGPPTKPTGFKPRVIDGGKKED